MTENKENIKPNKELATLLGAYENRLKTLLNDADKVAKFKSIALSVYAELSDDVRNNLNLGDFVKKVVDVAQLNIMPTSYNMYVVSYKSNKPPYKNTLSLMFTMKALQLILNRGGYYITTFVVREKDTLNFNLFNLNGSNFTPSYEDSPAVQYITLLKDIKTGLILDAESMNIEQINKHKEKFTNTDKFWKPHSDEMARKTVFKRLIKRVGFDYKTEESLNIIKDLEEVENIENASTKTELPKWKDNIKLTQGQLEGVSDKVLEQKILANEEEIDLPF